jgi:hypothetical protein
MILERTVAVLIAVGTVTACNAGTPRSTPSAAVVPMDLSLYTPDELRIFGIRCDNEISAALARGDTNSATGWGKVRYEIAARLAATSSPTPAPSRRNRNRDREEERTLPPEWYRTHVKVWDADRKHWHYAPVAEKKADPPKTVVLPSPTPIPIATTPVPTPTPGGGEQLDELIRQYRRAKGETP